MRVDSMAPWEISALKAAFAMSVKRVGGFEVAAMITGRSPSTLHGYGNVHDASQAPVDVVVRLERAAWDSGMDPILSALMARQVGHLQIPVPHGEGDLSHATAAAVRSMGEMAATQMEAMADGNLSDIERSAVAAHCDKLIGLLMQARAIVAGPALPVGRRAA